MVNLPIKLEPTKKFNWKSSYMLSANYDIVIFLTKVDDRNIIILFTHVFSMH